MNSNFESLYKPNNIRQIIYNVKPETYNIIGTMYIQYDTRSQCGIIKCRYYHKITCIIKNNKKNTLKRVCK